MDKLDKLLKTFDELMLKVDEERAEYIDYIERCRLEDMKEVRETLNEIRSSIEIVKSNLCESK